MDCWGSLGGCDVRLELRKWKWKYCDAQWVRMELVWERDLHVPMAVISSFIFLLSEEEK